MDPNTALTINTIESLKARYFRLIDTKDWSGLDSVLAPDVTVDTTALGGETVTGAANYITRLKADYGSAVTVHHGHMPEIQLTAADSATATWAAQALVVWSNGKRELCFGHDHDTYGLYGGQWLITATTSTLLHQDQS